jgi:hypothetical protein
MLNWRIQQRKQEANPDPWYDVTVDHYSGKSKMVELNFTLRWVSTEYLHLMNHAIKFVFLGKTNIADRTDGEAGERLRENYSYYSHYMFQAWFRGALTVCTSERLGGQCSHDINTQFAVTRRNVQRMTITIRLVYVFLYAWKGNGSLFRHFMTLYRILNLRNAELWKKNLKSWI